MYLKIKQKRRRRKIYIVLNKRIIKKMCNFCLLIYYAIQICVQNLWYYISALSRSFDSAEIYFNCSVHKCEWNKKFSVKVPEELFSQAIIVHTLNLNKNYTVFITQTFVVDIHIWERQKRCEFITIINLGL